MYTLWLAKEPNAVIGHDGQAYPQYLNGSERFDRISAYARDYAQRYHTHVLVEREDFATVEERDNALDNFYETMNDQYIADGERRADEMWAATHDEPCLLLLVG